MSIMARARAFVGLVTVVLCCIIHLTNSRSVNPAVAPDRFLEKFGYLPSTTGEMSAFHSPESREHAIKEFQRMVRLPDTGIMDQETLTWMMAPRCGVPDQFPNRRANDDPSAPQNFEVPGLKWKKTKLTWKIHDYSPDLDAESQRYAMWRAFKYWSDVSGLEFTETADKADINIKYGYGNHGDGGGNDFDGPGMVLAHAYFPQSGEVHFDDDEQWTMNEDAGTNLLIVAAHEIGHALGLQHSTVWESLMAPYYAGYVPESRFKLHIDDIDGIQYLYGPNRPVVTPTERSRRPPTTTTTIAPTTTTKAAPTRVPPREPTSAGGPDPCTTDFDAMFDGADGRAYVLRGKYIYGLDDSGVMAGYPQLIRQVFEKAPYFVGAAVYSRRSQRTYLFKTGPVSAPNVASNNSTGRRIWRYSTFVRDGRLTFRLDRGFPVDRSMDRLFPDAQAAFTDRSGNIQLLQGDKVYKYSEYYMTASLPEALSEKYPGIPVDSDAAITKDGFIYFFKGDIYRKYLENHGLVAGPKYKAGPWMGCSGRPLPR